MVDQVSGLNQQTSSQMLSDLDNGASVILVGRETNGDPVFRVSWFTYWGYTPVISVVSGKIQALLALGSAVYTLVEIFFFFQYTRANFYLLGVEALNFLRGLVQIVPFVGNAIIFAIDLQNVKENLREEFTSRFPRYEDHWNSTTIARALWAATWRGNDLPMGVVFREPGSYDDSVPGFNTDFSEPNFRRPAQDEVVFETNKGSNTARFSPSCWNKYGHLEPTVEVVH